MLRKLRRRKVIRENFPLDKTYKRILLDKASFEQRKVFTDNKVCSHLFDDDRFVNMLLQKDLFFYNKLGGNQTKRLFPFYPSYIPLFDAGIIVSKSEYYWNMNTIKYPCIVCEKETISFLGDYSIKNVLCGNCIKESYTNDNGKYNKNMHNPEHSKYHMNFFKINKEHQNMIFSKIMKRERSYYANDKNIETNRKRSLTMRLKKIEEFIKNLTD